MPKLVNIIDKNFGYLKVVSFDQKKLTKKGYAKYYYNCLCLRCNTMKSICRSDLSTGRVISCGCWNHRGGASQIKIKLDNKQFGLLKVIKYDVTNQQGILYQCLCKCGQICVKSYSNLTQGRVVSCGQCSDFVNGQSVSNIQRRLKYLIGRGILNYKTNHKSIDLALVYKGHKIAIEYDCWHWHKNKLDKDKERADLLISKGWKVLSIKSKYKLPRISEIWIAIDDMLSKNESYNEIILDDWGI